MSREGETVWGVYSNGRASESGGAHSGPHLWRSACDMRPPCVDHDPKANWPADDSATSGEWTADYRPPPKHYEGDGIDPWAVWDAFDLDRYTANAVKYLLRAGKKDIAPRIDDLKKARDYINKAIEREELRDVGSTEGP